MFTLLIAALLLPQALQQSASLDGVVVHEGTTEPVKSVEVSLSPRGNSGEKPSQTLTDDAGRFRITGIVPGRYELTTQRDGLFKPKGIGNPTILTFTPGATLKNVRIQLSRSSAISGRVLSAAGAPDPSAIVTAVLMKYAGNGRVLLPCDVPPTARVATNDRGEYRLFSLDPGIYYIAVTPQSPTQRNPYSGTTYPEGRCSALFYPGVPDPEIAVPIEVKAGADLGGIDIKLADVPRFKAAFKIQELPRSIPLPSLAINNPIPPRITITRVSADELRTTEFSGVGGALSSDGTFTTPGLFPGTYEIQYSAFLQFGSMSFTVVDRDVDAGTLIVKEVPTLRGHVKSDEPLPTDLTAVIFPMLEKDLFFASQATVSADGTFEIPNALEATMNPSEPYEFMVGNRERRTYVASVMQDGKDLLRGGFTLGSYGSAPVEITLRRGGEIEGVVQNRNSDAVANSQVVLLPVENQRDNPLLLFYGKAMADQNGRFLFHGVAPGPCSPGTRPLPFRLAVLGS